MHVALGTLAAAQTQGTAQTLDAAMHLLNYAATHPDAAVRFHKSDMVLYIHSNASYLSEPKPDRESEDTSTWATEMNLPTIHNPMAQSTWKVES